MTPAGPMLTGIQLPDGRRYLAAHDCASRCCDGQYRRFVNCCPDAPWPVWWIRTSARCDAPSRPVVPGDVVYLGALCFTATTDVRPRDQIPPNEPVSAANAVRCTSGCDDPMCPDCEPECCWVNTLDTDCDGSIQDETALCNCGEEWSAVWDWEAVITYRNTNPSTEQNYRYTATGHHVESVSRDPNQQCGFNTQRSGYVDFQYTDTHGPSGSGRFSYPLPPPDQDIGPFIDACGVPPYRLHSSAETLMRLTGLSYVLPATLFGAACLTYPDGPCARTCSRTVFGGPPDAPTSQTRYAATFSGGPGCLSSAPIASASEDGQSFDGSGLSHFGSVYLSHIVSVNVLRPCGGVAVSPTIPSGGVIRPFTGKRCQGCGDSISRIPITPAEIDAVLRGEGI